jgi:hypothetical protein
MISVQKGEETMKKGFLVLCATTAVMGAFMLSAPQTSAGWFRHHHPRRAEVNRREERQQNRIAYGVRTGRLTPGEARQLESQEAALKRQEREEVRANGGTLTRRQYRQLNHEENALSREIHRDNHN